jgi:hypothetical protein
MEKASSCGIEILLLVLLSTGKIEEQEFRVGPQPHRYENGRKETSESNPRNKATGFGLN